MFGSTAFISRLEKRKKLTKQNDFISHSIDLTKNKNAADDEKYVMKNVQIISDTSFAFYDPSKPGYLRFPKFIHGGEIKQFTFDCHKVTFVDSTFCVLARSVLQDLNIDDVQPISHEPGYDETTIVSPDGKFGIVMTSRFSPRSNGQIFCLFPFHIVFLV